MSNKIKIVSVDQVEAGNEKAAINAGIVNLDVLKSQLEISQNTLYENQAAAEADGLKYYWKLNEESGDVAESSSSEDVDITWIGGPAIVDSLAANLGKARSFTGSEYGLAENISLSSKFVMGICFVTPSILSNTDRTFCIGTLSPAEYFQSRVESNGGGKINYSQSTGSSNITIPASTFSVSTKYFMIFEVDTTQGTSANFKFYVNGNEITLESPSNSGDVQDSVLTDKPFYCMSDNGLGNEQSGIIDEIFIFDNVLISDLAFTPDEHYNDGDGKELF